MSYALNVLLVLLLLVVLLAFWRDAAPVVLPAIEAVWRGITFPFRWIARRWRRW